MCEPFHARECEPKASNRCCVRRRTIGLWPRVISQTMTNYDVHQSSPEPQLGLRRALTHVIVWQRIVDQNSVPLEPPPSRLTMECRHYAPHLCRFVQQQETNL
jgi:hypothetical protein